MKEKIQKSLSQNLLPYYRHTIYSGDIIRPIITFVFFFSVYVVMEIFSGWTGYALIILLVITSALLGILICHFYTPGKIRMLFSIGAPLLLLVTLLLPLINTRVIYTEIWSNVLATIITIPLFEMTFYFLAVPIISLANDPTVRPFFKQIGRICLLLIALPEFLVLSLIAMWSVASGRNILETIPAQWKQVHAGLSSLITHNLSLVLSILLLIATVSGIVTGLRYTTKRHAFHDKWTAIQDDLLQNFTIWIQHILGQQLQPRSATKFWKRKARKQTSNVSQAKDCVKNLVSQGSGETKRLWNLLNFFSEKLDSQIKKVISDNNLSPLLNDEKDGDKTVRELFDSAIVMFAKQNAKDCGSYTTLKTKISGFNSLENWKEYFNLTHDVSQTNYDILNRVYISYMKEKRSA